MNDLPGWVPVRPKLTGICGSDLALVSGKASLHLATLTSTPFIPGHEIVGEIGAGPRRGERVVVQPALGCTVRGVKPPCRECAQGLPALCRNVIDGDLSAGRHDRWRNVVRRGSPLGGGIFFLACDADHGRGIRL